MTSYRAQKFRGPDSLDLIVLKLEQILEIDETR